MLPKPPRRLCVGCLGEFETINLLVKNAYYSAMNIQLPFPIVITKEGKWFVASCPLLDIATQGKTEKEVKENMADLINDYMVDPDTPKPSVDDLMSLSLTNILVKIPEGVFNRKAPTVIATKNN